MAASQQPGSRRDIARDGLKAQPVWRTRLLVGTGDTSHKMPLFNFPDLYSAAGAQSGT